MSASIGRETFYKGIKMRSRLEADYAADLDRQGYRWGYEPTCFAGPGGQWLPDFGCTFADHGDWAIFDEVKPAEPLMKRIDAASGWGEYVDTLLRRMTIAWASRPDAMLRLMFWQYGSDRPYLSVFSSRRGNPWRAAFSIQPFTLIWPGMGQYEQLGGVLPPAAGHSYEQVEDGTDTCTQCGFPESNRRHLEAS